MATLSSAMNYALSGLSVTGSQSALVSRNVTFAGDENYTKKSAEVVTLPGGGASISSYIRSTDKRLLEVLVDATASASGRDVILAGVNRLSALVADPQDESSVPALVGKLQESLRAYESNPSSSVLANATVESARSLSSKLNGAADEVLSIRAQADQDMADSVDRINSLLNQFKVVNDAVVRGSGSSSDLSENLDQRDGILKLLSEEIGTRTTTRPNNDVLIYAEGGAVLFERSPRPVTFLPTQSYDANTIGQSVYIDGTPVTGPSAVMRLSTGRLASLTDLRDRIAPAFQSQIDQIAGGLVRLFAESDQGAPPTLPDAQGLFIDLQGGPTPAEGTIPTGLAKHLAVNPLADPSQGGNPFLIRDGGFGGSAYVMNTSGAASFQTRISQLFAAIDATTAFDTSAGLSASGSLKSYGVESAAWVESLRQMAQSDSDSANAVRSRATESLLRVTGVNIDQEMAALLDLEKAYQASSKVISIVDSMLATLLDTVG